MYLKSCTCCILLVDLEAERRSEIWLAEERICPPGVALGSKAVSWLNFRFSGVADRVNETEQICSSLFILFHPISSFGVLNWTTQKVGHSLLGHGNPNSHGPSVELAAKGILEVIAASTVDVSTES